MADGRALVTRSWAALAVVALCACGRPTPPGTWSANRNTSSLDVDPDARVPPGLDGTNGLDALEAEWADVWTMLQMPGSQITYRWLSPEHIVGACGEADEGACIWEDNLEIDLPVLPNAHELNHAYMYLRKQRNHPLSTAVQFKFGGGSADLTAEAPMRHWSNTTLAAMILAAQATASAATPAPPDEKHEFQLQDTHTAKAAHGATASKITPTRTEAAMKLFVVDKDKGPVKGVVIFMTGPDKTKYYAEPTDSAGYTELLVPVGRRYDVTYLSLGRREIAATVPVADEPNQSVKLTLRYKREAAERPLILAGVNFDTAKATIRPESFSQLDMVVDFMVHKKAARVEISGHTDNVGNAQANKTLSEKRAQACRNYIVSKGIDKSRLDAVGFGDQRPIAPNDTDEGRQKNRRIEAKEL